MKKGYDERIIEKMVQVFKTNSKAKYPARHQKTIDLAKDFEMAYLFGHKFILSVDYSTLKYFYISESFCDFTGADKEKTYSEPINYIYNFIHPAYIERMPEMFDDMLGYLRSLPSDTPEEELLSLRISYNYKLKRQGGGYAKFVQKTVILEAGPNNEILLDMGVLSQNDFYSPENKMLLIIDKAVSKEGHQTVFRKEYAINESPPVFSEREKTILNLIRKGFSSPEIARQLYISEFTVKNHKLDMFQKIGVRKVTEMLKWAESQSI